MHGSFDGHAGVTLPLLQQSVLFFNLGLSWLVLRKDIRWEQVAGVLLVASGVAAAAWPGDAGASVFQQVGPAAKRHTLAIRLDRL